MGFEPTTLGLGSQCSTAELISRKSITRFTKNEHQCSVEYTAKIMHISVK